MAKPEKSELGSKLTRREFLGTSLKIGLGAVGVAVTGVGCAPAATPQAAPATPTPQPAAPTAVPKEPYVLEFWQIAQGSSFQETMAAAIKEFEETHPNIKVNLTEQPASDLRTKAFPILTDGGPGPDIIYDGAVMSFTYAGMPFGFMDVTDRIEAAGIKEKIPDSPWVPMREEDGKIVGMPWAAFPFFLVYNKSLYEAAGVDLPETWEDLSEVTRKMLDPSKDTFGMLTLTNRFVAWLFEVLLYDSGAGYLEGSENFDQYDLTKPITITKPEAVTALEYLRSLAETAPGGLKGNIGVKETDINVQFAQGNIGHIFTHSILVSQIPGLDAGMVPKETFDVMVFPKGPKRRGVSFSTSVYGITRLSKDPDAAWEFVKFIGEWEGRIAPSAGMIPIRSDVKVDEDAVGSWLLDAGREALAGDSFPQAFFPQYNSLREPLADNVQAYFLDQKTALQALEDTATAFKDALAG